MEDRLLSSHLMQEDEDMNLRPQFLSEYVGAGTFEREFKDFYSSC